MLCKICSRDEGEYNIGGEAVFELFFDSKSVCGVHYDASMLGGNDGMDDVGEAVDVWQGLDAEDNVVEGWPAI